MSVELLNQPQPDQMTMDEFIAECGEEDRGVCIWGSVCCLFSFFILIRYFVSR
jgi:hypothetical protein